MSEESFDIDNQIREGNERAKEYFKERKENTLNQLESINSTLNCNHEEINIDSMWWTSDNEVDVILKCEKCKSKFRGVCKK
jgi:hypothetical protein